MSLRRPAGAGAVAVFALAACGGGRGEAAAGDGACAPTVQEIQCQAAGWQRRIVRAEGLPRLVLWKAPAGAWQGGAIVVMHGGGGRHTNCCAASVALIAPQVRFTEAAIAAGCAVFLLDSSDLVTDNAGRLCGKVWDDEVRARPNLDLPFVEQVLRTLIPSRRPTLSRAGAYLTGLSSGGCMGVRAATRRGDLVSAFAPVSAVDPYGWQRDCTPRAGDRGNVFGVALANETGCPISEAGACVSVAAVNERPWDGAALTPKPPLRVFHHAQDGIHDRSCVENLRRQLADRGCAETPPFMLDGGPRRAEAHDWLDEYNAPLLAFFAAQRRAGGAP